MLLNFFRYIGYDSDVDYRNRISYIMVGIAVVVTAVFLTLYILYVPFFPAIAVHVIYILFNLFILVLLKRKYYTSAKFALTIAYITQLTLAVYLWFPVETGFNLYYFMVPMAAFQFTFYDNKVERYFSILVSALVTVLYFISAVYPLDYYMYDPGEALNRLFRALTIITLIPPMTFMFNRASMDQNKMQKELSKLANTDALTSVLNRRALFEHGVEEFNLAKKYRHEFTLILFDVDFFKNINDRYGHPAGDSILVQLTQLVKNSMRREDVFARYGGEEFAVVARRTTDLSGRAIAHKLHKRIESYGFVVDKKVISMTVSVGVVQYHASYKDFDAMMLEADKALYIAKEEGRNRIVFGG